MKPTIFYLIAVLLFLLPPICGLGIINTMVSEKYEVRDARLNLETDDSKSEQQKNKEYKEIEELEKSIKNQQTGALTTGIAAFLIATVMLIKRNKIIKRSTTTE